MEYVLLKTKYNEAKSQELHDAVQLFNLSETVVDEAFDGHDYSKLSYRAVPSLLAVYDDNGKKVLINETDNHLLFATFKQESEAKLDEYLAQ